MNAILSLGDQGMKVEFGEASGDEYTRNSVALPASSAERSGATAYGAVIYGPGMEPRYLDLYPGVPYRPAILRYFTETRRGIKKLGRAIGKARTIGDSVTQSIGSPAKSYVIETDFNIRRPVSRKQARRQPKWQTSI